MHFGVHVSIAKGLAGLIEEVKEYECETFQLFTSSPRSRSKREYGEEELKQFAKDLKELKIKNFVVHAPYYINLASPDDRIFNSSVGYAVDDLKRADLLGAKYWVVHMGSHTGSGHDVAVERNIRGLENIFEEGGFDATIMIETTAGQGTQIGDTFEDIAALIDKFSKTQKIGVVLDTQHTFAAGYDWTTKEAVKKTLDEFDKIIGLKHLKVMHINDSVPERDSHVDRHEHIGKGHIGLEGFHAIIHDPRLKDVDAIAETHSAGRKEDMEVLKAMRASKTFKPKELAK